MDENFSFETHPGMIHCHGCGRAIHRTAASCPRCGAVQRAAASEKLILPALLLCLFFGWLGAHRFYVGKTGTAILQIVTFGGLGIWVLIDCIMIIIGSFEAKNGQRLTRWV